MIPILTFLAWVSIPTTVAVVANSLSWRPPPPPRVPVKTTKDNRHAN